MKQFLILVAFFNVIIGSAQDKSLYMPLNFQKAYQNNTRNFSGIPGKNYWQNHSAYDLQVSIDVENNMIQGQGTITYLNNSPDTLGHLIIRLYQDLFEKAGARDFPVSGHDIHDGTNITFLKIHDTDLTKKNMLVDQGTNSLVTLPELLYPGNKITLEIGWEFQIPKHRQIRYGKYGDDTYFIAYWYPEISVYDDIDGWDKFHFGGMQEFYHDFSDFHVEITMPGEYMVWATGEFKNPEQILHQPYLDRYKDARTSEKVVHIIAPNDVNSTITKNRKKNTWIYHAENIPDFAFAISNQYVWDAVSYQTSTDPPKNVLISAAYDPQSSDFHQVADISLASVKYFSEEIPGIPFPYPSITVFNGSGGMEFPMMVNDGSMVKFASTVQVTSHEIAHTYFPFMTGTNERKYAWMDEGWAVFLPANLQSELVPGYQPMVNAVETYEQYAGNDLEVPLMISSINISGNTYRQTYRIHAYYRSAVAYYILYDFLGKDLFLNALQTFISRWEGKHPIPYDFFFTFNDVVNEDLSWFWNPWFFEMAFPDLTITSAEIYENEVEVIIKKTGKLPVPVHLELFFDDGTTKTIYHPANVWQDGGDIQTFIIKIENEKKPEKVILGHELIPEVREKDNVFHF